MFPVFPWLTGAVLRRSHVHHPGEFGDGESRGCPGAATGAAPRPSAEQPATDQGLRRVRTTHNTHTTPPTFLLPPSSSLTLSPPCSLALSLSSLSLSLSLAPSMLLYSDALCCCTRPLCHCACAAFRCCARALSVPYLTSFRLYSHPRCCRGHRRPPGQSDAHNVRDAERGWRHGGRHAPK